MNRRSGRGGRFGRGRGGRSGRFGGRSNVQCQVCYKVGHDAINCYHRFNANYVPASVPPQPQQFATNPYQYIRSAPQNALVWTNPAFAPAMAPATAAPVYPQAFMGYAATVNGSNTPLQQSQNWIVDSGASHHITGNPNNFATSTPLNGQEHVFLGNGKGLPINSVGSTSFTSSLAPNTYLHLNNMLLVPQITRNLVSVSKFAKDNNVFFEFHPYVCLVKSQVDGSILLRGHLNSEGLYSFPSPVPGPSASNSSHTAAQSSSAASSSAISPVSNTIFPPVINTSVAPNSPNTVPAHTTSASSLWHLRLGHPNHNVLNNILPLCNKPTHSKSIHEFCVACCMGKLHKLPSQPSTTVYNSPLEFVFCDVWALHL